MKLSLYALPNALAVTTGIIYVACRVLVGLFPEVSFAVAQSWFHGIGLSKLDTGNLTLTSFVFGLVSSMVLAWVVGFVFVKIYKLFKD